jgi:hypothetical protein
MSDRKLRPWEKAVNYAAACILDDKLEMQRGPSTSAGPSKGQRRAKKRRITKSHSLTPEGPQSAAPPPPKGAGALTFVPMVPKTRVHSAYNTLPAALNRLDTVSPEGILRLFLTQSLQETIAKHTNKYAEEKREK